METKYFNIIFSKESILLQIMWQEKINWLFSMCAGVDQTIKIIELNYQNNESDGMYEKNMVSRAND